MKQRRITRTAAADIDRIADYILQDNPDAAFRYYEAAYETFRDLPDWVTPVRADEELPEYVRQLGVKGFAGYTLRIAIFDEAIYLLNAFAPGVSDGTKRSATGGALDEQ